MQTATNQPGREILAVLLTAFLCGCGSSGRGGGGATATADLRSEDLKGLPQGPVTQPTRRDTAVASINNQPVLLEELAPLLAEASGAQVLRELALDRAAQAQCRTRNVTIDAQAIAAEEALLLESIERDAAAPGGESGMLLESIRRSRGLGERRFRALLERNAMLRALVRDSVEVSGPEVEQAMMVKYGERFRVRVIVMPSERDLAQLKQELERAGTELDVAFAKAAATKSTDASASRGGLLAPISPADATYPAALRSVLSSLDPNRISPVIALNEGFALLLLDSKTPSVIPPANAADQARAEVRTRKERIAMEAEAKRLLTITRIEPLTPELEWSWRSLAPQ